MGKDIYDSIQRLFDKLITEEEEILQFVEKQESIESGLLLTYFNQHAFNIFWSEKKYRESLIEDFHIFPDGIGLFGILRFYKKVPKRLTATDIYSNIFNKIIDNKKYRIAIIGGSEKLHKIIAHSGLKNIIFHCAGNFNDNIINKIEPSFQTLKPNIIMIGMGIPLQEEIALKISKIYSKNIIICVGNFFEFYFGNIKRAPKFLQMIGLEWFFRLLTEPRRLWKRYLIGIPKFIFLITKIFLIKRSK